MIILPARDHQRTARRALAIALAVLLAACSRGEDAPPAAQKSAPPAIQATIIQVSPQRVPIAIDAVGQVEGSKEVEVRARVPGILLKRLYAEGELVRAGTPLFQIDPAPFQIAKAQAEAQLAQERARNEQARRESARLKQLIDAKAISQREYDDSASALKLSNATLQAAQARVSEAELNLSYTLVTAPVSGVSGRAIRSEGSLVTAGADSLLTTISQVSPIWVRFSISESDLAKLPGGRLARKTAEVALLQPDGVSVAAKGRINFAATQIDPRLGTQQLRAEFGNERGLLVPGQFVRVRLIAGTRDNVFLVPQAAVMQNEKGHFVFALDAQNKATIRPVQAGEWVGANWAILAGLKAGDRVVGDNLLKLQPGMPVAPAAAPAAAAK
ncbi:MAG: efflux RND transporter periplasmic adaptor subunit [Betaproteobacteria bacterium]|nr:efflux RND transporter periplasmic adaptor subunit [Betaproteobacteria bacterium]